MMTDVDLVNLTIRIEPELRARLDAIAKRDDRSVGYIVRQLLSHALDAQERAEKTREAGQ